MQIKDSDTVQFECKRCGLCCQNRGDILLTSMDVFKISEYLKITCKEFVREYAMIDEKIPGLVIKSKSEIESPCIFYNSNKCLINEVKPYQCVIFPIDKIIKNGYNFVSQWCDGTNTYKTTNIQRVMENSRFNENEMKLNELWLRVVFPIDKFNDIIISLLYEQFDTKKCMEQQVLFNLNELLKRI